MAAQKGRDFLILKNSVAIAGQRETGMSVDGSPVDITSKDDSGYQTLAEFSGVEKIELTASGVWKDDTIRSIALAGTGTTKLLTDITLEWGDGATLSGDFYLSAYSTGANHEGEETYDITLQSSEAWTYTAAA